MDNLVDMAMTPEESAEMSHCSPSDYPKPIYPYGLCICLENDQIEKLGLDLNVDAGAMMIFKAAGKVTAVSSRDTDKGPQKRVEIQIIGMSLGDEHQKVEKPAPLRIDLGKLYKA